MMTHAFASVPVPGCFYESATHREALAAVLYAASYRVPLSRLGGGTGTGKSAVLAEVAYRAARSRAPLAPLLLNEAIESGAALCAELARLLACDAESASLQARLRRLAAQDITPLLLLDNADRLGADVWRQVRGLCQWDLGGRALLPVVLVGGAEVETALPVSLRQELDIRVDLRPLKNAETVSYIEYLWTRRGEGSLPLSDSTVRGIADTSEGIPRVINRLCRQSLRQPVPMRRRSRKTVSLPQAEAAAFAVAGFTQ
jgi:general secretion pathway protein A